MRRRYFYWPVSLLSVLIIFVVWIILEILDGWGVDDFYTICFWGLFIFYLVYFNYPIIRNITLRDIFSRKKSDNDKLADRHLGEKNSAAETYEFLKPIRFISDHAVYRRLTLVYAAGLTLLVVLLYYYAPPGHEKPPTDSLQNLLYASILVAGIIAYTSLLRFFITKYRDYPYYLAKAYFALSETEKKPC